MANVLVVEDDATVGDVVVGYLKRAGHQAARVGDGLLALAAIAAAPQDLIVLDVMLPGLDGLQVCSRVRERWPELPVLMLTALNEPEDRIAGLEVGADDYLSKPFSPRELVLRVDSVLRRATAAAAPGQPADGQPVDGQPADGQPGKVLLRAGSIALDPAARRATRDGRELTLTVRELDLLAYLLANPGRAFTREHLMREVWGWTFGDQSTVTVHVRRLREKIEPDPTEPTLIHTVWGIGYRLDLPEDRGSAAPR